MMDSPCQFTLPSHVCEDTGIPAHLILIGQQCCWQVIRHEKELRKRQQLTPEAAAAHMQAASLSDRPAHPEANSPDASPFDTAAHEQRLKVVQSSAGTILTSVFSLMQDR